MFEKPCMLRQMIVSAVPTGHVEDSKEAKLNVFVKDIKCGTSSRFVCVYEGLEQPVSGSIMISLEVGVCCMYGWVLNILCLY